MLSTTTFMLKLDNIEICRAQCPRTDAVYSLSKVANRSFATKCGSGKLLGIGLACKLATLCLDINIAMFFTACVYFVYENPYGFRRKALTGKLRT